MANSHHLISIYKPFETQNLPQNTNLSLISSGHGGFQVGSGQKQKIPEESAGAEDGVQQHHRLSVPTNSSNE
jgi:hypothetical protein